MKNFEDFNNKERVNENITGFDDLPDHAKNVLANVGIDRSKNGRIKDIRETDEKITIAYDLSFFAFKKIDLMRLGKAAENDEIQNLIFSKKDGVVFQFFK